LREGKYYKINFNKTNKTTIKSAKNTIKSKFEVIYANNNKINNGN
jgi:hypothetical protein